MMEICENCSQAADFQMFDGTGEYAAYLCADCLDKEPNRTYWTLIKEKEDDPAVN